MLRNTKGFTLIELLIVVVIIGILAAIAIPKFSQTKEKAYVSAMQSDLRNLAAAQESYFAEQDPRVYGGTVAALGFDPSSGVTIVISNNDGIGWSAVATHANISTAGFSCAFYTGGATYLVAPADQEGEVKCG